jgi:hypothetical protein
LFQVVDTSSSLPLKPLNIFQPSRPTENTWNWVWWIQLDSCFYLKFGLQLDYCLPSNNSRGQKVNREDQRESYSNSRVKRASLSKVTRWPRLLFEGRQ